MSKILRYDGNVEPFGTNAEGTERTVFGGTTQANDLTSQVTTEFLRGWGIVGPNEFPTLEDFNALGFTLSQFIAYLHQAGIAEWDTTGAQEYHLNSYVNRNGVIFVCKTNAHTSVTPPEDDPTNWKPLLSQDKVDTIEALLDVDPRFTPTVFVKDYHSDVSGGGGAFSVATGRHNGGTFIDPARPFPTDWNDQVQLANWFADSGIDVVGYKRNFDGLLDVKWFGAKGDYDGVSGSVDTLPIDKAYSISANLVEIYNGTFISDSVTQINYVGDGKVLTSAYSENLKFINLNFGDTGKKTRRLYCIPRQETLAAGWAALTDAGHEPNGVSSIVKDGNALRVNYNFAGSKVGHFTVVPDESYAGNGIRMGSSVGTESSNIFMYSDLDLFINNSTLGFGAQFFYEPDVSIVDNLDGTITVTHPQAASSSQIYIESTLPESGVLSARTIYPKVVNKTADSITYGCYQPLQGYVEYNGTSWVVTTNSVVKPTVTVGSISISLDFGTTIILDNNLDIKSRDNPSNIAQISSQSSAVFNVGFRDYAGNQINPSTSATTDMKFWFSSDTLVLIDTPIERTKIRRTNVVINPDSMYGTFFNMWVSGEMEVE